MPVCRRDTWNRPVERAPPGGPVRQGALLCSGNAQSLTVDCDGVSRPGKQLRHRLIWKRAEEFFLVGSPRVAHPAGVIRDA